MRTIAIGILVGLLGCGSRAAAPPIEPRPEPAPSPAAALDPELTPALAPVAWLLGDWGDGADESLHWRAAGGAIYGVHIRAARYAVFILDDGDGDAEVADGTLRLIALGDGRAEVTTAATTVEPGRVTFGAVELARAGEELALRLDGQEQRLRRVAAPTAPALEAADLAFDTDTRARGVDGWVAAFAVDGVLWRGERIQGHAAIAAAMTRTLTGGILAWTPIASATQATIGFTVGKATYTPTGAAAPVWRGSYVTIWAPQADGTWKVAFDTGRGEHAPAPAPAAATGT
jgi:hypothetical protein